MTTKIVTGKLPWYDKTTWVWPEGDANRLTRWFRDGPGDLDGSMPIITPLLKGRRTCVQAGGCVGIWPVRLSMFFEAVHTFEPEDVNFTCLEANTIDIPNVTRYHAALGEEAKMVHVEYPEPGNPGTFYVQEGGSTPMMTIDSLELENVDLIYLDVEGYEVQVLRGAAETIERCRPVIGVEEYPNYLPRFGLPPVRTWVMEELNYEFIEKQPAGHDVILAPL